LPAATGAACLGGRRTRGTGSACLPANSSLPLPHLRGHQGQQPLTGQHQALIARRQLVLRHLQGWQERGGVGRQPGVHTVCSMAEQVRI